MTINTLNFISIKDVIEEWKDKVNKIGFQFHTPFVKDDPLWIPYGEKRSKIVEELIKLQREYPNFVINNEKQLNLMKGNWGRKRYNSYSMSNLGNTFFRSQRKRKETMLYRKL
jgi:Fe-coproporphyrin III synthase